MADTLSISESIAGLIALGTKTANQLNQFIASIRASPDGIRDLWKELIDLCSLLKRLQTAFNNVTLRRSGSHKELLADLEVVLDSCMDKFIKLQILVRAHEIKNDDSAFVKRWKLWRWSFQEKEVMALKTQLEVHKATLNMALMITSYTSFASPRDSKNMIEETSREIERLIVVGDDESTTTVNSSTSYILQRYLSSATSVYSSQPESPGLPTAVGLGTDLRPGISFGSIPRARTFVPAGMGLGIGGMGRPRGYSSIGEVEEDDGHEESRLIAAPRIPQGGVSLNTRPWEESTIMRRNRGFTTMDEDKTSGWQPLREVENPLTRKVPQSWKLPQSRKVHASRNQTLPEELPVSSQITPGPTVVSLGPALNAISQHLTRVPSGSISSPVPPTLIPGSANKITTGYSSRSMEISSINRNHPRPQIKFIQPPPQTHKLQHSTDPLKVQRQLTSNSNNSQDSSEHKCLITWPRENKQRWEESVNGISNSDDEGQSEKVGCLSDKERNFEELISSGRTIHITITPEFLRGM